MKYTAIKSEEQYTQYLDRIYELMNNCEPNTTEGDELELLGILVLYYENEYHSIPELEWYEKWAIKVNEFTDSLFKK